MPGLINANGTNHGDNRPKHLASRESKIVFSALAGKFTLVVALSSFGAGSCAAQEWILIEKDRGGETFIDKQSIKRKYFSSVVEFYVINIFPGPAQSRTTLVQFDCNKRISRGLWQYNYQPGDKWGKNPPESIKKIDGQWEEIPPDPPGTSTSKNLTNLICG